MLATALSLGCASSRPASGADGGATVDARVAVDGPSGPSGPDAGAVDAGDAAAALPDVREVVSAGGRIGTGSVVMEVTVGNTFEPRALVNGTRTVEGRAVVNP